jgi:hypothetical protein
MSIKCHLLWPKELKKDLQLNHSNCCIQSRGLSKKVGRVRTKLPTQKAMAPLPYKVEAPIRKSDLISQSIKAPTVAKPSCTPKNELHGSYSP